MKKANTTANQIKAKLGLRDVSDTDAAKAFTTSYNGLLNNPKYPNLPFDLATYKAGIDQFSALIVDAEDGGKKAISAKDKNRIEVTKLYTLLGHYAEMACNDDLATFNTSGFTQALTLAGSYQFQIRALGVLGYTDWMDPKTFVVA